MEVEPINDWMKEAECKGLDPSIFVPLRGGDHTTTNLALLVCRECVVKEECLDHGLRYRQAGIWGGTTDTERRHMRRAGK